MVSGGGRMGGWSGGGRGNDDSVRVESVGVRGERGESVSGGNGSGGSEWEQWEWREWVGRSGGEVEWYWKEW